MSLPGNTALPSSEADLLALAAKETGSYKYSVDSFFKKPEISSHQISLDGKRLSFKKRNEKGKTDIWVRDLETGKEELLLEEGEDLIRGYGWANNDFILYMQDKGGDENFHIFRLNVHTKEAVDLTPFDGVRAELQRSVHEPKHDTYIISMNKNRPELFEPYRLTVSTGELVQLEKNEDLENPIHGFEFDKDGQVRAYLQGAGLDMKLFYKVGDEFKLLRTTSFSDSYGIVAFDYTQPNPHLAYIISNMDSDKERVEYWDLEKNECLKVVYENEEYDVGGVSFSRHRGYELDAITYVGARAEFAYQSPTIKAWMDDLEAQLRKDIGDADISIFDSSEDESKLLVAVGSDRIVGRIYLYTPATKKLELLQTMLPHLHFEDMAKMLPITFKSRDGLTLHGYLTLPNNIPEGQKVPMIVNPHGGPQGVRDYWGFNPEAQLFASRGYATLHVNFRISGGYGKKFLTAGFGQIGRACMDDVEDGMDYVLANFPIDAAHVGIYGGSHGGYAVLRGMTKTPERYACGVDYVGVANLFTFMQTMPPYWLPFKHIIKKYWYDEENAQERAIMEEVSPVMHVDKFQKPLFVVQGANDPRVNIDEADQIVTALRGRGLDVPYMVKYDEGHGFGKESNRLELYKCMMGFFAEYLK